MINNGARGGRARLAITAGLAAAIALGGVAAPTMQASAATITVNQAITGSYNAYKLINGTFTKDADGKLQISDAKLVDGTKDALVAVLEAAGKKLDTTHGDTALANSVTDALIKLSNSKGLQSVANKLVKKLTDTQVTATKTASAADGTLTFDNVEQGYYLIAAGETPKGAKTSAMLLPVTGEGATATLKGTTPTVDKTINDPDAGLVTGNGATLPVITAPTYTITGTVSSNISDFDTYQYKLVDTMPKGVDVAAEEIQNGGSWKAAIKVSSAKVTTAVDVTDKFTASVASGTSENSVAMWAVADLKAVLKEAGITGADMASAKVVLTYSPVYDQHDIDALYANYSKLDDPQVNTVHIEFSNDPYTGGEDSTDTTPDDKTKLYSYNLEIKKVDDKGDALKGAEFTLTDAEGNTVGKDITAGDTGTFSFTGLDSGKQYTLTETKVPQGKKGIAPIKFTINANKNTDGETIDSITPTEGEDPSNAATFTVDGNNTATIDVKIVNVDGPDLPLTGQAGIAAGVAVGGLLIAVSAVAMVRKRGNAAE